MLRRLFLGVTLAISQMLVAREFVDIYRNPVVDYSLPDPSVVKAEDGYYYLFATEDIRNMPICRSSNLVDWKFVGTAFTDDTRPAFEPGGGLWAPDINKIGDKYVLYYSMSRWGGEWTCGVGVATSDSPAGPFQDKGMMFRSNEIGIQNCIDPFYIEDNGKKFLFWGSFRGIYGAELSDDGLSLKQGTEFKKVAGSAYEGTYIYKRDGYYYLFASTGTCCEGVKSTYQTVVGRSKSLWGPYVDKQGRRMLENHHELLIGRNDRFVGTGHNSELVTDDVGQDWILYHGVNVKNPGGRVLLLDRVDWKDGWPEVDKKSASAESEKPVFFSDALSAVLSVKVPGNKAVHYPLHMEEAADGYFNYEWKADTSLPVLMFQKIDKHDDEAYLTLRLMALEDVYFNFNYRLLTGILHANSQFYMPGFWYRRNQRSPKSAPSFQTSDSWVVREDRLSAPLTGVFDSKTGASLVVSRTGELSVDALTTHKEGEVILSGETSLGFIGFENLDGQSALAFGYPYKEAPKSYLRKLTLAPEIEAYRFLEKGKTLSLTWKVKSGKALDFSDFICQTWEDSYDTYRPMPVDTLCSVEEVKNVLSRYFVTSLVDKYPLVYNSGAHIRVDDCRPNGIAEVGFIGRTLLNAFNAWEYGWQMNRHELINNSARIFDSYLKNGFTSAGFFREYVDLKEGTEKKELSIRRQSEGVYAMLHYLSFEKQHGRRHAEWEDKIRHLLDAFLHLQKEDGSFPRKFYEDFSVVDASGGSTPSATLPLVMGYKYFKDKRYLAAAKRTADYLEHEIIAKSDYFSSTLDANCEDKEASLYAATATYYLALVTSGNERLHYAKLCRTAAYFALSWYYLWDVPFAKGQMLGDIGLKTRGWGNVSVENNHIDVFVFEFADVLRWLSEQYSDSRFAEMADVIFTSMRQLLPFEGHLCGVARPGYYPEVVQHTSWDYGHNGKGFYNDIFAPGWTVASLWELYTPGRAEKFLKQ